MFLEENVVSGWALDDVEFWREIHGNLPFYSWSAQTIDHVVLSVFSKIAKIAWAHSESFLKNFVEGGRSLISDAGRNLGDRCFGIFLQHAQSGDETDAA